MSKVNIWDDTLFVKLHSHEFDNLVVIVPDNFNQSNSFNVNAYLGSTFYAISIPLAVFILFRKCFRCMTNSPKSDLAGSFIDTLGAYLGTKPSCKLNNRPERLLVMTLFIFSQTTLIWFSGSLIQSFMARKVHKNLDTLVELANSGLLISMSIDASFGLKYWGQYIEYT